MMSTIDWVNLIYNDWAGIFAPITLGGRRNYHQDLAQGEHTLRDGEGRCQLSLTQKLFCIEYDKLVTDNFNNSAVLKNNGCTRRSDYALFSTESNDKQVSLLIDLTSTGGNDTSGLEKIDKKTGLTKFDKVQKQLAHSITALSLNEEIKTYINGCPLRLAVCAYRLNTADRRIPSSLNDAKSAFNRPLISEYRDGGQVYASPDLNQLGFEYRRIQYPNILSI